MRKYTSYYDDDDYDQFDDEDIALNMFFWDKEDRDYAAYDRYMNRDSESFSDYSNEISAVGLYERYHNRSSLDEEQSGSEQGEDEQSEGYGKESFNDGNEESQNEESRKMDEHE